MELTTPNMDHFVNLQTAARPSPQPTSASFLRHLSSQRTLRYDRRPCLRITRGIRLALGQGLIPGWGLLLRSAVTWRPC